ncbi:MULTISPECIES: glycosyltransferase [Bacillus]|uniref:glycosyltransferase n=1 Tax=Bacillus TaxID=1386 RepID=UPI000D017157|nr:MULTISPECIES: glycosyltransferase [Bacillus]MDR0123765.1 glycosyltransferase [Bacillus zhangzhouensis]PRO41924.1 glycosyl transferase [Bacillus sp. LLTC93]
MKKNICMFVWNHFTNDARVLRECTALSEDGCDVDLICIHDPSMAELKTYEEINERFRVHRVKRYPQWLILFQSMMKLLKEKKYLLLLLMLVWVAGVFYLPLITIPLTILFSVLLIKKVRTLIIRASIFLRMILKGWQKNYDVFHSNDLNTLPQGVICAKFKLFNRKKLIYDSHEVQTSRTGYDSKLYGKMESFLLKFVDQMIVENHTRAKYNEDLYGFYPKVVHNYPFDQKKDIKKINLHEILNIPKNEKILLYQGGIQTGRGLENLVKAAPDFKEGILVFIGDGRIKESLMQLTEDMKLTDKVKFLPKVPLEDLPKYTKSAYLGFQVLNNVCFNHYSASSNKLFEYIMAGVPVIACDFPEIKKVVAGENIGVVVDSHDPNSIATGVNKIVLNTDLRNQYSENCHKARLKYNWEQEKKSLLEVYGQIQS